MLIPKMNAEAGSIVFDVDIASETPNCKVEYVDIETNPGAIGHICLVNLKA